MRAIYEFRSGDGVGPIRLGMSRTEVGEVMKLERGAGPKKSHSGRDYFFKASLCVSYTARGKVEFIGACPSDAVKFVFKGKDLFKTTCPKTVAHLSTFDAPDEALSDPPDTYTFPGLIMTLAEPSDESGRPVTFQAIGLGSGEYLEAMQLIKGGVFKKKWPGKRPNASEKAVVEKLDAATMEIAFDHDGYVRRLSLSPYVENLRDDDLRPIAGLAKLEALHLGGQKKITDACFKALRGLKSIKGLSLGNTGLTDGVMKHLKQWPGLIELSLPAGITAKGLAALPAFEGLRSLSLELRKGASKGLVHLEKLPRLVKLSIEGALGNAGLLELRGLTRLRQLSVYSAGVTEKGASALQKHLPDLQIYGAE